MNIVLYISEPLYHTEPYRQLADYLVSLLPDGAHILHRGEIPVEPYSLVHFLGCPDFQMARAFRWAARQQVATVFSPLGCLQPWATHGHPALAAKRALLVKGAVMQADAIHAWSEAEMDTLDTLRWNSRVALIPNAVVAEGSGDPHRLLSEGHRLQCSQATACPPTPAGLRPLADRSGAQPAASRGGVPSHTRGCRSVWRCRLAYAHALRLRRAHHPVSAHGGQPSRPDHPTL